MPIQKINLSDALSVQTPLATLGNLSRQRKREDAADVRQEQEFALTVEKFRQDVALAKQKAEADAAAKVRADALFAQQQALQQATVMQGKPGEVVPDTDELPAVGNQPAVPLGGTRVLPHPAVAVPGVGTIQPQTSQEIEHKAATKATLAEQAREAFEARKRTADEASAIKVNEEREKSQLNNAPPVKSPADTPHTVTTAQGVMQYNPETKKFDTKIGDRPPSQAAVPKATMDEREYEDYLKSPEADKYGRSLLGFRRWKGEAVPTADVRSKAEAAKKIEPVLEGISELSEKINTGKGIIAKISGGVEKAKAQANYNDDVAEYQALISGFTPMIARGVGHTGVLTQQDVDSVKEMFPKPGDSKTLRDRKIARLKTIMGTQGAESLAPKDDLKNVSTDELLRRLANPK